MKSSAPEDLVVEVLHNRGDDGLPDWSVGSGFVVGPGLVLTAAYNVGEGELLVRLGGREERSATVRRRGDENLLDLAILAVDGLRSAAAPPVYGAVDRHSTAVVEGCRVVGFPRFNERAGDAKRHRLAARLDAEILAGENLDQQLLTLRVTSAPRALPTRALAESEWSGMSGAVVFAGDVLVGVITEHHRPDAENSLALVPITAIDALGGSQASNWWRVLGVERANLVPLPTGGRPPYRSTIAELAPVTLLGREAELEELAAFATGAEGYRWYVGGPWTGKTALAAHFARACPSRVDAIAYFLERRRSDADSGRFLQTVNEQLAHLLGEQPERLDDPDVFRDLWSSAAAKARSSSRHLLLVVDGLDEDFGPWLGRPSVAQLLPKAAGDYTHVLVTSRRYPELPHDMLDHPLLGITPVGLSRSAFAEDFERRARHELDQMLGRRDADSLVTEVLGIMAAAQGALSVDDLTALAKLGDPAVRRPRISHIVNKEVARVFEPINSMGSERFLFAHDTLREQTEAAFGAMDLAEYRRLLHIWAERWRQDGWPADRTPSYLIDTYPALLRRSAPENLDALYGDLAYLDAGMEAIGVDRLAADLHAANAVRSMSGDLRELSNLIDRESHHLRSTYPVHEPGYFTRQVCLQALQNNLQELAERARHRLESFARPQLVPIWTTKQTARELVRTLEGHWGFIQALAVDAAGARAVSGSGVGEMRVWDLNTGARVHTLDGHADTVLTVAVDAAGSRAVSASDDGTVRVWDLTTGRHLRALESTGGLVLAAAMDAAGTRASTGSNDGTLQVWNPNTGEILRAVQTASIWAVAMDAVGARAITGSPDGTVRVWNANTGELLRTLEGHVDWVHAVAVDAAGTRAVSGSSDGMVLVWDLTTGELLHRLEERGQWSGVGERNNKVDAVAMDSAGARAVSGGFGGIVHVWDLGSGKLLRTLEGHAGSVMAVAMNAAGTRAVSAGDDAIVRVWDLTRGEPQHTLEGHTFQGHIGRVEAVDAVGGRAVSGGVDGTVRVWDLTTGELLRTLEGHVGWVHAVAVDAGGTRAVSGGWDGRVWVWDLVSGEALFSLEGHTVAPNIMPSKKDVNAVAVNSAGTRAVSGGIDGTVRVWDLVSGAALLSLDSHLDPVYSVALNAGGTQAASGHKLGLVRIWDLTTGELLRTLEGHGGPVNSVTLSAAGTRAVTGTVYGTIQVWDLSTGDELRVIEDRDGAGRGLGVNAEGTRAVSGGPEGTMHVWDLTVGLFTHTVVAPGTVGGIAIVLAADGSLQVVTGDSTGAVTLYVLPKAPSR